MVKRTPIHLALLSHFLGYGNRTNIQLALINSSDQTLPGSTGRVYPIDLRLVGTKLKQGKELTFKTTT
jgi:hypothetical protein